MSEPKKIGTSNVEVDPADHPSVQAWQELAPEHGGVPAGAGNRETTSDLEERHMLARGIGLMRKDRPFSIFPPSSLSQRG